MWKFQITICEYAVLIIIKINNLKYLKSKGQLNTFLEVKIPFFLLTRYLFDTPGSRALFAFYFYYFFRQFVMAAITRTSDALQAVC